MRKKYYLFITLLLCLSSCSLTKTGEKVDVSSIVIPDTEFEYFEVDYITINWSDILKQNKETYYVYIYSLTCTHCQELKNYIIGEALKRDDIYFVKGSNKDVIKTEVSDTIGATEVKDIAILGYPTMLKIKNKTLVQNVAGNSKIIDILK